MTKFLILAWLKRKAGSPSLVLWEGTDMPYIFDNFMEAWDYGKGLQLNQQVDFQVIHYYGLGGEDDKSI